MDEEEVSLLHGEDYDDEIVKAGSCCSCSRRVLFWTLTVVSFVLGGVFFSGGFLGPMFIESQVEAGVEKMVVIDSKDSKGYKTFQDNTGKDDVPVLFSVWAWNLTNADEFGAGTADKPIMEQLGPYVYRKNQIKGEFTFPQDGKSMKYVPWTYYTFEASKSVGDPHRDMVTTASLPLAGVRMTVGDSWWQQLAEATLSSGSNTTMFVTKSVNELVWGYEAPLLELLAKAQPGLVTKFGLQVNTTSAEEALETHGFDEQKTGKGSLDNVRDYTTWANKTSLTCWGSAEANKIKGGDGLSFPPGVAADDTFTVFVDSVFRHTILSSSSSATETVHGIKLQVFGLDDKTMKNASEVPANKVYYAFGPSGVQNLSSALHAPVFASQPHFLDAPWYQEQVVGMQPNKKKHATFISVEPITGITMHAAKRLQVNVKLDKLILLNDQMESVYLPVAWFEESSEISEELADEFKSAVYGARNVQKVVSYVGWMAGGVLLAASIGFAIYILCVYKSKEQHAAEMYKPINTTMTDDETVFDAPRR